MEITTIGIDLAKSVFHVHSVDQHGKAVLRKKLERPGCWTFLSSCARV